MVLKERVEHRPDRFPVLHVMRELSVPISAFVSFLEPQGDDQFGVGLLRPRINILLNKVEHLLFGSTPHGRIVHGHTP